MVQKIDINSEQAKSFAYTIYKDIFAYVQSHQKEYQEFLLENNNSERKDENDSKRKPRNQTKQNRRG